MNQRNYYTEFAEKLPQDAVILTAGCAKYRYNKLPLGDIGGIPRVLDAGQCNDSYSLVVIAMKLKEIFGLDSLNAASHRIQYGLVRAESGHCSACHLASRRQVHFTLDQHCQHSSSPNVAHVLVEKFGIAPIGEVDQDIRALLHGKLI